MNMEQWTSHSYCDEHGAVDQSLLLYEHRAVYYRDIPIINVRNPTTSQSLESDYFNDAMSLESDDKQIHCIPLELVRNKIIFPYFYFWNCRDHLSNHDDRVGLGI